jgi:NAD(P)-dependent dehydrogenase (short-subunit alcohol dehydrogenase family)
MAQFTDHVIIVTGASEGIGRALCLALAPQRPKLVLAARNHERLTELAEGCQRAGAEPLVAVTDVGVEEDCHRLVERTIERFGRLDALVNNAGIGTWCRFDETRDLSIFERSMRVNFLGSVYATHYALPHLKQSRGRLVAISSIAGLTGVPMYTAYAATKHAMFGFFDSLRIELRSSGVTVTMIAPDFVASTIHKRALGPDGRALELSPHREDRFMTTDACASRIVRAMEKRQRLAILSLRGRWVGIGKRFAPALLDWLAARSTLR